MIISLKSYFPQDQNKGTLQSIPVLTFNELCQTQQTTHHSSIRTQSSHWRNISIGSTKFLSLDSRFEDSRKLDPPAAKYTMHSSGKQYPADIINFQKIKIYKDAARQHPINWSFSIWISLSISRLKVDWKVSIELFALARASLLPETRRSSR